MREESFEWLIASSNTPPSVSDDESRNRLHSWLIRHARWDRQTWRPDNLGDRLTFGLTYFDKLCKGAPTDFQTFLALALTRQARHLFRLRKIDRSVVDHFKIWRGGIAAAIHLPDFQHRLQEAIAGLETAITKHVLPDGGHFSRNPHKHLEAMAELIHINIMLTDARINTPKFLQSAINNMAPMLRAYQHADRGLSLFNGSTEGDPVIINLVLKLSANRAKRASNAPHSGFHRIGAHRTAIILDAGDPVDLAPLVPGHAGTLSFEMSIGPHRMIVNCGSVQNSSGNHKLREALRSTAAHSTLTVANIHSSDLLTGGGLGGRRAKNVEVRRYEKDRNILIEASHNGYQDNFGLIHKRSLYLARDGLDVRGEDILKSEARTDQTFDIRFHLHPEVRASLSAGGQVALIKLPTGRGWRFMASNCTMKLEESIYVGGNSMQRSQQIVISGQHTQNHTLTKWRLAREG